MKHFFKFIIISIFIYSCNTVKEVDPDFQRNYIEKNQFTFVAKTAQPSSNAVQVITSGFPSVTNSQILNLSGNNTLILKKDSLIVDLPYFGISRSPQFDSEKNGVKFSTPLFKIEKKLVKNKKYEYILNINDPKVRVNQIIVEIFFNKQAYIFINFHDRQPIGFDGYIER